MFEQWVLSIAQVTSLILVLTCITLFVNENYWQYCKYHPTEKSFVIDTAISMRNHHTNCECK